MRSSFGFKEETGPVVLGVDGFCVRWCSSCFLGHRILAIGTNVRQCPGRVDAAQAAADNAPAAPVPEEIRTGTAAAPADPTTPAATEKPAAATAIEWDCPAKPGRCAKVASATQLEEPNRPKEFYAAMNAVDAKPGTAWCEGVPDDGIGQWVELRLAAPKPMKRFGATAGYGKNPKIFKNNNRVKEATLSTDTGCTQKLSFKDLPRIQFFPSTCRGPVSKVKLTIDSVYPGAKFKDTCISEVDVK